VLLQAREEASSLQAQIDDRHAEERGLISNSPGDSRLAMHCSVGTAALAVWWFYSQTQEYLALERKLLAAILFPVRRHTRSPLQLAFNPCALLDRPQSCFRCGDTLAPPSNWLSIPVG
jgi:hypothetical protein